MRLESDVSTIHKYISALSNKIDTPTLIDPINLKTIMNNIQKVLPTYLSLPHNAESNIWSF